MTVDMLVLHYTGMQTCQAALERLCDPDAKVSSHWLVEEDGQLFSLVTEDRRAWHAGVSSWRGLPDTNGRSIGIEIVNPGHEWGYRPFPDAQIQTVIRLCRAILGRHPIPAQNIVAHSDIAPDRKTDPGELFPWARLATAGIGLWPRGRDSYRSTPLEPAGWRCLLAAIGYPIAFRACWDEKARTVLQAFQRRYRPSRVDGIPDAETWQRLVAVARLYGVLD